MGLFSKFKSRDGDGQEHPRSKRKNGPSSAPVQVPPAQPLWEDAWTRTEVEPEEIQELLRVCTQEMKSRALDLPFLLLPFRPASDPSAARTFIRNYFNMHRTTPRIGETIEQELLLTEPMVISSVMKWCWSRLAGGVVGWEAYELFRVGEQDSMTARDAFATFIPLSVESDARSRIIFDFFDLLAAVAAHSKTNGMGGRKLSRYAGWWAFDHKLEKRGFDEGYGSWSRAADATSHLFFAYLRSLSPDSVRGISGISTLPLTLQALLNETPYPLDQAPSRASSKVVMVVDSVSPTPFALLRRAKNFEYRDEDRVLRTFSEFDDPVSALSVECRRVLMSISSINEKEVSTIKNSTSLGDASWSRFQDMGFGAINEHDDSPAQPFSTSPTRAMNTMHSAAQSRYDDGGRPTTPSWADFLSSGFAEGTSQSASRPLILPPDKILPPIDVDRRSKDPGPQVQASTKDLEPGELASIRPITLDDGFWWAWISSLAGEETTGRKAVFGRCALIETTINGAWVVIEELVKGAAADTAMGGYVAEKKGRFTFGRKRGMTRSKSVKSKGEPPKVEPYTQPHQAATASKLSIGRDQHAKIQAAAAALQEKQKQGETDDFAFRRNRGLDARSTRTNSVFTLQPVLMNEAGPAMKWANSYDKKAVRAAYLGDDFAGAGKPSDQAGLGIQTNDKTDLQSGESLSSDRPHLSAAQQTQSYMGRIHEDDSINNRATSGLNADAIAPAGQVQTKPPAPLPLEPESRPDQELAKSAAEVPLPENGDLPPGESSNDLAEDRDINAIPSPQARRNRLRKKEGRNLKGMFRKKTENASPLPQSDPLAAAAARSALSPKSSNHSTVSLARRLSRAGRKETQPTGDAPAIPQQQGGMESVEELTPPRERQPSQMSMSFYDSDEQRKAEQHFPQFDSSNQEQEESDEAYNRPHHVDAVHSHHAVHNDSAAPFGSSHHASFDHVPDAAKRDESPRPSFTATSESASRPSTSNEPVGAHFDPPFTKRPSYKEQFTAPESASRPKTLSSRAASSTNIPSRPSTNSRSTSYNQPRSRSRSGTPTRHSPHRAQYTPSRRDSPHQAQYTPSRHDSPHRAAYTPPSRDSSHRPQYTPRARTPQRRSDSPLNAPSVPTPTPSPPKGHTHEPSTSTVNIENNDEEDAPPVAANDRWAQIRKNAAERAARSQEDTKQATAGRSEHSEGGQDEAEEETIESRVARIKARVAELTGNMPATEARS